MKRVQILMYCTALLGVFAASAQDLADRSTGTPSGKTADEVAASYRGSEVINACELAEVDHNYVLDQLALAQVEVKRLVSEIKIEGAGTVDIGGEIRAARMVEAAWQRAAETVANYIDRLDSKVAER
jgi:hypothetical protein